MQRCGGSKTLIWSIDTVGTLDIVGGGVYGVSIVQFSKNGTSPCGTLSILKISIGLKQCWDIEACMQHPHPRSSRRHTIEATVPWLWIIIMVSSVHPQITRGQTLRWNIDSEEALKGYRRVRFPRATSNPCHSFHWKATYQHEERGKFDRTMIIDRLRLARCTGFQKSI